MAPPRVRDPTGAVLCRRPHRRQRSCSPCPSLQTCGTRRPRAHPRRPPALPLPGPLPSPPLGWWCVVRPVRAQGFSLGQRLGYACGHNEGTTAESAADAAATVAASDSAAIAAGGATPGALRSQLQLLLAYANRKLDAADAERHTSAERAAQAAAAMGPPARPQVESFLRRPPPSLRISWTPRAARLRSWTEPQMPRPY